MLTLINADNCLIVPAQEIDPIARHEKKKEVKKTEKEHKIWGNAVMQAGR